MNDERRSGGLALMVGPLAAIGVAGVLVPARRWLGGPNVALLLGLVVVATAAVSDRRAAATTAVLAAVSYNFFHTAPYYTLRVADRVDLLTVALVLLTGLAVGELAVLRRRATDRAGRRATDLRAWQSLMALAAQGDRDALVAGATDLVRSELHLVGCTFEPAGVEGRPLAALERNGSVDERHRRLAPEDFELPADGVEVPVVSAGRRIGRLVLHPTPGTGLPLEQRRDAVAVADLLAAVLAATDRSTTT